MKLLLVEDDDMIGAGLQKALKQSGYSVNWLQDGNRVEPAVQEDEYALIILDLNMPGKDGLHILRNLRAKHFDLPVLILTARDGIDDRVLGLDSGADDYMVKPFALAELEARVRLLLRRYSGQSTNMLCVGSLQLNLDTRELHYKERTRSLSAKELRILRLLMSRPNAFFTRSKLEEHLYGWNEEVESNSVEVHIHQIRKKLGKEIIQNTRNMGYRIGADL